MQLASLAARLLDALLPPSDTARIVRECSADAFGALLASRVIAPNTIALLPYRHRLVRAAIIEAKFHRNEKALALLASALADYLAARVEESRVLGSETLVVVPIPLGGKRRRERGYNQVEEVARRAQVPYEMLLTRTRETKPQTSLSGKKRVENMQDAFALRANASPSGKATYLILDDVTTTGATLAAAAAALRGAGTTRVELLALAH